MNRRNSKSIRHTDQPIGDLRLIAWQIKGFAYLIENHNNDGGLPLDNEALYYGLGTLLGSLGTSVENIAIQLEDEELYREKKTPMKSQRR